MSARAPAPVLVQAQKSYAAGDYLSAIRLLERGLASGQGLADPGTRAEGQLYLAAAYFAKGDDDAARRTLVTRFTEAPDAPVAPELFPPRFLALVDRAREDARAAASPPPPPPPPPDSPRALAAPPNPSPSASPSPPLAVDASRPPPTSLRGPWWLVGLGGATAVGGGACLVVALLTHQRLTSAPTSASDVLSTTEGKRLAAQGTALQVSGWAVLGAGALAALTGVVWLWLAPTDGGAR